MGSEFLTKIDFGARALIKMEQFFDEIRPILEKTIIYSNTSRDEEIFKLKNENEQYIFFI